MSGAWCQGLTSLLQEPTHVSARALQVLRGFWAIVIDIVDIEWANFCLKLIPRGCAFIAVGLALVSGIIATCRIHGLMLPLGGKTLAIQHVGIVPVSVGAIALE